MVSVEKNFEANRDRQQTVILSVSIEKKFPHEMIDISDKVLSLDSKNNITPREFFPMLKLFRKALTYRNWFKKRKGTKISPLPVKLFKKTNIGQLLFMD